MFSSYNKKYSLKDVFGWGVYFKYGKRNFKFDEDFKKFPQPLLRRNIITGDEWKIIVFHEDRFLQYMATLDDKKSKHNVDRNIVQFDSSLNPLAELSLFLRTSLSGPGGFEKSNVPQYLRSPSLEAAPPDNHE